MLEKIKKVINKPASWMYFVLVVALLIIISNNSTIKEELQAELDNANDEISTLETTLEAAANEVAVRDDAIAGLNDAIAGLESDSVTAMLELNNSDTRRAELEGTVADVRQELSDTKTLLDVCVNTQAQ